MAEKNRVKHQHLVLKLNQALPLVVLPVVLPLVVSLQSHKIQLLLQSLRILMAKAKQLFGMPKTQTKMHLMVLHPLANSQPQVIMSNTHSPLQKP